MSRTFMLIKSHAIMHTDFILRAAIANGLTPSKLTTGYLSGLDAAQLYDEHKDKPYFSVVLSSIEGLVSYGVLTHPTDAVTTWRALIGHTDPALSPPDTLRHLFGVKRPGLSHLNAVHGSSSPEEAEREINLFYPLGGGSL
jgi:nucleoside-diphosphate kinase